MVKVKKSCYIQNFVMTKVIRFLLLRGSYTAGDSRGSAIEIIRFPFSRKECL